MARSTDGHEVRIVSLGSSGDDINHLLANTKQGNSSRLRVQADEFDSTGFAASLNSFSYAQGLRSWSLECNFRFGTTAQTGYEGLVTFGSGYVLYTRDWSMELAAQVIPDVESYSASGVAWKEFRPGLVSARGTYLARPDSATAVSLPTAAGAAAAAAVFKMTEEGATDNSLDCSIRTQELDVSGEIGRANEALYGYTVNGDVTVVGSTNFLPAGAIAIPDWDANADGAADVSLVWQTAASRTFTGMGFWSRLSVRVPVNGLIEVGATFQGTGAITPA